MDSTEVLAPDLMSVRGYRAPHYPQSSSSMEAPEAPSREFIVTAKRYPAEPAHAGEPVDTVPAWAEPTVARMVELMQLPPGWDSYEGMPPSVENFEAALTVLNEVMSADAELPWIVPLPSGGFQLEWHLDSVDIEISVDGGDSAICVDALEVPIGGGRWRKELPRIRALIAAR